MSFEIRGLDVGRNFEISLRRRGIVNGMSERSAHAQNIISWRRVNDGPSYEDKNPCFLIDWSCHLPFKEDTLREEELACHEYS